MEKRTMKMLCTLGVVVLALVAVPLAAAGPNSSITTAYGGASNTVVKVAGTKTSTSTAPAKTVATSATPVATSGTLPFTGVDLGVVLVAGVALAGVGFGMRRLSRQKD